MVDGYITCPNRILFLSECQPSQIQHSNESQAQQFEFQAKPREPYSLTSSLISSPLLIKVLALTVLPKKGELISGLNRTKKVSTTSLPDFYPLAASQEVCRRPDSYVVLFAKPKFLLISGGSSVATNNFTSWAISLIRLARC